MTVQSSEGADEFARYARYNEASRTRIDYTFLDDFLDDFVMDVGRSNREPARGRLVGTGTRLTGQSSSRYRHEGNRVWFHRMPRDAREALSQYRAELERLPAAVGLETLSSNEQLAYWLNLHNVVVLDEIAQRYPIRRVDMIRIDGERLHDAKIINLDGHLISLNDIRFRIVGPEFDDPRVIYGFFSGAVGGPTLQDRAFNGARVWAQLSNGAGEFVNSLRGVDSPTFGYKISPLFEEWRGAIFASWPEDLTAHLQAFAEPETREALGAPGEAELLTYDWTVADLTNGRGCANNRNGYSLGVNEGNNGQDGVHGRLDGGACPLPASAVELIQVVRLRRLEFYRQGRFGSVTVRDIATQDPDDGRAPQRVTLDGEPIENDESR